MGLEMGKLSVKEIENRWTKGEESMSVGKGGTEDSDGDDVIAAIVLVGVVFVQEFDSHVASESPSGPKSGSNGDSSNPGAPMMTVLKSGEFTQVFVAVYNDE